MPAINKVILMGRLTADPELKHTQSGVATCQITVAVDRNYTSQNGDKQTDFLSVIAWRQAAEFICKYFSKGKLIIVEGSLRSRIYEDKRYPDVKHYVTEVYADNVQFGETKAASQATAPTAQTTQTAAPPPAQPAASQLNLSDFEEVSNGGDLPF